MIPGYRITAASGDADTLALRMWDAKSTAESAATEPHLATSVTSLLVTSEISLHTVYSGPRTVLGTIWGSVADNAAVWTLRPTFNRRKRVLLLSFLCSAP